MKAYAQATRSKGIELTVEHTNVRGWTFWEKQGFRLDREFRIYFKHRKGVGACFQGC